MRDLNAIVGEPIVCESISPFEPLNLCVQFSGPEFFVRKGSKVPRQVGNSDGAVLRSIRLLAKARARLGSFVETALRNEVIRATFPIEPLNLCVQFFGPEFFVRKGSKVPRQIGNSDG